MKPDLLDLSGAKYRTGVGVEMIEYNLDVSVRGRDGTWCNGEEGAMGSEGYCRGDGGQGGERLGPEWVECGGSFQNVGRGGGCADGVEVGGGVDEGVAEDAGGGGDGWEFEEAGAGGDLLREGEGRGEEAEGEEEEEVEGGVGLHGLGVGVVRGVGEGYGTVVVWGLRGRGGVECVVSS